MSMKLTNKQEDFCQHYVANGSNAAKAAISAGYPKKAAKEVGYENLTKPHIAKRIAEIRKPLVDKLEITKETVLEGILDIAQNGEQENNRLKAHDMLGKYVGLYELDNAQGATQNPIVIYLPEKQTKDS